ncbi:MAG: hypothetical protein FD143_11 [Ignavibacteria bacterium]|nr:MAG: hypothetical protein FD143_11 [Ignavibacteria bacterium]KAF0158322.1 MAG: hypothetical protein FD188_2580 [Ignavibacteria bacterium]
MNVLKAKYNIENLSAENVVKVKCIIMHGNEKYFLYFLTSHYSELIFATEIKTMKNTVINIAHGKIIIIDMMCMMISLNTKGETI